MGEPPLRPWQLSAAEAAALNDHKRDQIRRGLLLTPAERLAWLEDTMVAMRALQKAAHRT